VGKQTESTDRQIVFNAHGGGNVVDFDFSPFDDDLLASGGDDGVLKLWRIESNSVQSLKSFAPLPRRVEIVKFHPLASNVCSQIYL
jgi:WD40 repeat protein